MSKLNIVIDAKLKLSKKSDSIVKLISSGKIKIAKNITIIVNKSQRILNLSSGLKT